MASEHKEINRRRQVPRSPRYAETRSLRRASQSDDRQVLPAPMIAHIKADASATVAGDWCMRRSAWRAERPSPARFIPRTLTCRRDFMIHLIRRLAFERRVRPVLIEPDFKEPKLPMERLPAKWDEDDPRAFVLEAQVEPFNERDTPMLTDGAEAGCDPLAITPVLDQAAPERLALQGKGATSRSLPPRRTVRESFPSHRSSLSRASCLTRLLCPSVHLNGQSHAASNAPFHTNGLTLRERCRRAK